MAALMRNYGEEIISKADLQNDGETIILIKILLEKEEELTKTIIPKKKEKEFNIQKDSMRRLKRRVNRRLRSLMLKSEYLNKVLGTCLKQRAKSKLSIYIRY